MFRQHLRFVWLFPIAAIALACSSSKPSSFGSDDGDGGEGSLDGGAVPRFNADGGDAGRCVNLECQQQACPAGTKTTVSGIVYDPAMIDPLYNAIVYVPNAPPDPFTNGASCDKCSAQASGSPIVSTITDARGSFVLEDVPVGAQIPLVIQIGKWRRQVTIPEVKPCVDNPLTDKNLTRLPKNKSEGDIPLMAIASGGSDPFECLLLRIGLDANEFTAPGGGGRIEYYQATGGATLAAGKTPSATELWSSAASLSKYDLVLLPCEGDEYLDEKPPAAREALVQYTNGGGRVFITHYGYSWLAQSCSNGACGAQPFWGAAKWDVGNFDVADPVIATLDTSFPKGQAFASWLHNVGASPVEGQLEIGQARRDLDAVVAPTQGWMTAPTKDNTVTSFVPHITFNTPIGAKDDAQCGRVVFSDFHVAQDERNGSTFPSSCKSGALTAQEQALEFMLFDLSACIQTDHSPPKPPPSPR